MSRTGADRLYAWEDRVVGALDRSAVPFAQMQSLVDHVWSNEGLRWPPRVRPRAATKVTLATGSRLAIEAPDSLPSWILLHEVAHAMTSTADGQGAGHGPDFIGLYLHLLVRYCRLDRAMLEASLKAAGIRWNPQAKPAFLDPG